MEMNFATVRTETNNEWEWATAGGSEKQKYVEPSGSLFGFIMNPIILIVAL